MMNVGHMKGVAKAVRLVLIERGPLLAYFSHTAVIQNDLQSSKAMAIRWTYTCTTENKLNGKMAIICQK